ncbi:MAG: protein translocase subunit SecF [Gammaproteobacteria bacterium]|nr:protein translocase subunit SecF [Gammaproteobacteria bacterium]MDE0302329.1 protein translocase subunit SecF [Gammaproteobacteria bacterium]
MRLLPRKLALNFMGRARHAMVLSGSLLVLSIGSLLFQGLNLGVDFEGGTLIEVGYPAPVELDEIRGQLEAAGFDRAVVQHFGSAQDVLVRIKPDDRPQSELSNQVLETLRGGSQELQLRRVEYVGPQVGEELRDDGGLAMLYALGLILIYVALRFEYRFSFGAVIALVHDVILTIGFFSLTQIEFDLTVLAAILAVIGYSLNDTIVVFDRIRENFRALRRQSSIEVLNVSINQTLSRTLMTSLTTLLVLFALFFFGGEVIHAFSIALIVGVIIGTYSSIYVAGSSLLVLGVSGQDLDTTPTEDADDRP